MPYIGLLTVLTNLLASWSCTSQRMANQSCQLFRAQSLTPVGLAFVPLRSENPLVSTFKVYPESDHFFPPHCYPAGPHHHRLLFRSLLKSPKWSVLEPLPSVCHTKAGWLSILPQNKKGHAHHGRSPPVSLTSSPFHFLHSTWDSCCPGPPQIQLLPQAFVLSAPCPRCSALWFPMICSPLFYIFLQMWPS